MGASGRNVGGKFSEMGSGGSGETFFTDNGTDLTPKKARGIDLQAGEEYKINGAPISIPTTSFNYLQQTGVIDGWQISINGSDPSQIDLTAGNGQVVNTYTDKLNTTVTPVSTGALIGIDMLNIATKVVTFFAIDSIGAVHKKNTSFTAEEKRNWMVVGVVGHTNHTTVTTFGTRTKACVWQTGQTISDVAQIIGIKNVLGGNDYSGVTGTLQLQKTPGLMFAQGSSGTDNKTSNYRSQGTPFGGPSQTVPNFLYVYEDAGGNLIAAGATQINPNSYIKNGVLTAAPVGQYVSQTIGILANGLTIIGYGTDYYSSSNVALNSILGADKIDNPVIENMIRRNYITVAQGATNLDNAIFTDYDDPDLPSFINSNNRGIIRNSDVVDEGGINISWGEFRIYDQTTETAIDIIDSGGLIACTDNAVNFLFWRSGTSLTLDIVGPIQPADIAITRINVDKGDIWANSQEDDITTNLSNLLAATAEINPTLIKNGMSVSEDPDVTNAFDVIMDAGVFFEDGHKKNVVSAIYSRINLMTRHFKTAGVPDSDTNAQIDVNNYNNGTDLTAIPAGRYAKGMFIFSGDSTNPNLHWVYPTEVFTTVGAAIDAANPPVPVGLEGLPKLTAYVQQQGESSFAAPGDRWRDLRGIDSVTKAGGVTAHDALTGLAGNDHPQYYQYKPLIKTAVNYNPSIVTTNVVIAITDTSVPRTVIISTEDIASGSVTQGRFFTIKDESGLAGINAITVQGESGTIDGVASALINGNYNSITIYADGTNLWII